MLAQYNMDNCEPLYMLTEAEKIIDWDRRKATQKRKIVRLYYIKQKICGSVMLLIGIIVPFILDGNATFSLLAIPLGVYLLITRQKVIVFRQ